MVKIVDFKSTEIFYDVFYGKSRDCFEDGTSQYIEEDFKDEDLAISCAKGILYAENKDIQYAAVIKTIITDDPEVEEKQFIVWQGVTEEAVENATLPKEMLN